MHSVFWRRLSTLAVAVVLAGGWSPALSARDEAGGRIEPLQLDGELLGDYGSLDYEEGRLIVIERARTPYPGPSGDVVRVVRRSGELIFERAPGEDVPGSKVVNVKSATLRARDRLVVAMLARSIDDQNSHLLLEYDLRSTELVRIVRTDPVICRQIQGDGRGSLWCVGTDVGTGDRERLDNVHLLHRFDRRGRHVGALLNRRSGPRDPEGHSGLGHRLHRLQLVADPGGGMTVWLPSTGGGVLASSNSAGENVKTATLSSPFPVRPGEADGLVHRVARGPNGALYATVYRRGREADDSPAWMEIVTAPDDGTGWRRQACGAVTVPATHVLIGSDGTGLVFFDRKDRTVFSLATCPD